MAESPEGPKDTPRFKSPPYPFVSLPKAVERARSLFTIARNYPVSMSVLAEAWNYSSSSSGVIQTAAALIQFGLLSSEGSGKDRKFQLTASGVRLAQDTDPTSEKRYTALRLASLSPKIYAELWAKFGDPKGISDSLLKNYLVLDRIELSLAPFSEAAAMDVIAQYRETMAYIDSLNQEDHSVEIDQDIKVTKKDESLGTAANSEIVPVVAAKLEESVIAPGERLLQEGMLSKHATYRIFVKGSVGPKEIDYLIAKLKLDREILSSDE